MDNRTALAIQVHKAAIKLILSGKFTKLSAIRESMRMMKEVFVEEVKDNDTK